MRAASSGELSHSCTFPPLLHPGPRKLCVMLACEACDLQKVAVSPVERHAIMVMLPHRRSAFIRRRSAPSGSLTGVMEAGEGRA